MRLLAATHGCVSLASVEQIAPRAVAARTAVCVCLARPRGVLEIRNSRSYRNAGGDTRVCVCVSPACARVSWRRVRVEGGGEGGPQACVWEALACVWEALAQHMCKYVCWRHWRVRGKAGDGAAPACPGPGWPGRVGCGCVCARAARVVRTRVRAAAPARPRRVRASDHGQLVKSRRRLLTSSLCVQGAVERAPARPVRRRQLVKQRRRQLVKQRLSTALPFPTGRASIVLGVSIPNRRRGTERETTTTGQIDAMPKGWRPQATCAPFDQSPFD